MFVQKNKGSAYIGIKQEKNNIFVQNSRMNNCQYDISNYEKQLKVKL